MYFYEKVAVLNRFYGAQISLFNVSDFQKLNPVLENILQTRYKKLAYSFNCNMKVLFSFDVFMVYIPSM